MIIFIGNISVGDTSLGNILAVNTRQLASGLASAVLDTADKINQGLLPERTISLPPPVTGPSDAIREWPHFPTFSQAFESLVDREAGASWIFVPDSAAPIIIGHLKQHYPGIFKEVF